MELLEIIIPALKYRRKCPPAKIMWTLFCFKRSSNLRYQYTKFANYICFIMQYFLFWKNEMQKWFIPVHSVCFVLTLEDHWSHKHQVNSGPVEKNRKFIQSLLYTSSLCFGKKKCYELQNYAIYLNWLAYTILITVNTALRWAYAKTERCIHMSVKKRQQHFMFWMLHVHYLLSQFRNKKKFFITNVGRFHVDLGF